MAAVTVSVIDSGIHAGHPHVQGVSGGAAFDADGREHADWVDRLGHGTAVAAAIRDLAPSVELLAAKVFDRALEASVPALVSAIEWSAQRRAHLINLSLGVASPDHRGVMRRAVEDAAAGGAVIVAAGADADVNWLPGTLAGVLRVELDWACRRGEFTCARDSRSVVFRTCGYPRPIPGVDPARNLKGLSFAVANMTGLAARVMTDAAITGFDELVDRLSERAVTAKGTTLR